MTEWENWLEDRFPGFLLPHSAHHAVPVAAAERFLRGLALRPDHLDLLRTTSLFSQPGIASRLARFAREHLPDLIARLPSTSVVERRAWEGGFQGRLDVRDTLREHLNGHETRFITRARKRSFDLLETRMVRSVVGRLVQCLLRLRDAGMHRSEWGAEVTSAGESLPHLLVRSRLREVPDEPVRSRHVRAAQAARHPAFEAALEWHALLEDAWSDDVRHVARLLAEGALKPAGVEARFEIAVLVRLLDGLRSVLPTWDLTQGLVLSGRRDIATFRQGQRAISLFYNQPAGLPLGPRHAGIRHYFGVESRWRPDFSVRIQDGHRTRWVVGEVKCSHDPGYQRVGYAETLGYRHEFAPALIEWPKAILVVPAGIVGSASFAHDVIAVNWAEWVPEHVLEAMVRSAFPA